MAETRVIRVRVPESLEDRARQRAPEVAALDISRLVRVGLATLAGLPLADALELSRKGKPGPAPRAGRERTGAAA